MSSFVPLVPHAKHSGADSKSSGSAAEPAFNAPVRWTLRVLAWLAFGVASYLAWHAMTQTSVAGCSVGSNDRLRLVLTSSWSKWLGIPVAVLGLGLLRLARHAERAARFAQRAGESLDQHRVRHAVDRGRRGEPVVHRRSDIRARQLLPVLPRDGFVRNRARRDCNRVRRARRFTRNAECRNRPRCNPA